MKIDLTQYQIHYHNDKQMKDNWQEGIRILPFSSNPTSMVDRGAGLSGVTGGFFRMLASEDIQPIEKFTETENIVREYLINENKMDAHQAEEFILVFRDIMQINGTLNISDVSFLKYIPLVPSDPAISDDIRKKYRPGTTKLVHLLHSMVDKDFVISTHDSKNLFTKLIKDALSKTNKGFGSKKINNECYTVLSFIKQSFADDLKWLIDEESSVVVRYIHLFLHFYVCYILLQTIPRLSHKERKQDEPINYYFILKSERASVNHDAVKNVREHLPKALMDKIYGRTQALDIANCVLGGNIGFYPDIIQTLSQTPFEENKSDCEELLRLYQKEKREVLNNRKSESASMEEITIDLHSYDEFLKLLEKLCMGLQSPSYTTRIQKKVKDILGIRMLQLRRGNYVLVLDNELLVFLAALVTKGKRTKLVYSINDFKYQF